ncbi:hypothetical protein ElyMa_005306800 [Elysia marginata]|uniref:Uncharacterized protein n=1 Tax=Elysia marginata TaxID=1093978 RepID=A0AAV4JYD0_9GAST|nr:hypothetical protein ElyMa_005306800 [Elysia marginata]
MSTDTTFLFRDGGITKFKRESGPLLSVRKWQSLPQRIQLLPAPSYHSKTSSRRRSQKMIVAVQHDLHHHRYVSADWYYHPYNCRISYLFVKGELQLRTSIERTREQQLRAYR